jgi:hypothetical protein
MRGVLATWMRQSPKLEQWKVKNCPKLSLHTMVGLHTGEEVLNYQQYNHLQVQIELKWLINNLSTKYYYENL